MLWVGNCSIIEPLPELIQQVRQNLTGAIVYLQDHIRNIISILKTLKLNFL